MEDNVRIEVIGIQSDMMDDEKIELHTTGKWFSKNGKEHIIYTNHDLVESGETRTRVTIAADNVSIIRSGAVNTHLVFEMGQSHIIPYETPFGMLEMVSHTKSIEYTSKENRLELKVLYNLDINNSDMGESTFHIIATRLTGATS